MRITYPSVLAWATAEGKNCTPAELNSLLGVLEVALNKSKDRDGFTRHALQQAEILAKDAGYGSLDEMLQATGRTVSKTAAPNPNFATSAGKQIAAPRKPYLDPLDPNTEAFAVYKDRAIPAALQRRIDEGWSLEEMHYKRIAAGRKARGLDAPYDPIQKHAELMAQEPVRYKRK